MNLVKSLFLKSKVLSKTQFLLLSVLMMGAYLAGLSLSLFDVFATTAFFNDGGQNRIALDYIFLSFLMIGSGAWRLLLGRRFGIGSFSVVTIGLFISAVSVVLFYHKIPASTDVLFILKYLIIGLYLTAFWSVSSRLIPLKIDSLKMAVVICAFLGGMISTGLIQVIFSLSILSGLVCSVLIEALFVVAFCVILKLLPIAEETFTHRGGGTTEREGGYLVAGLLLFAFCCAIVRVGTDYLYYTAFFSPVFKNHLTDALTLFWSVAGTVGFLMLFFLYRTRYLYTTLGGMCVFAGSVGMMAVAVLTDTQALLLIGYVLFYLTFCFYVLSYYQLLPMILIPGHSKRIKTRRLVVVEPTGFLLGALGIYFYPSYDAQSLILLGVCSVIVALLFITTYLYSDILLKSFQMRFWRGSLLLIAYPKMLTYVLDHLRSSDADETIYFLRVLAAAKHPVYEKYLLKSLRHEQEAVRLFVLDRLNALFNRHDFYKSIERTFEKDASVAVQNKALSILIPLSETQKNARPEDFVMYIDNKKMKQGALIGFLKTGGDKALLAMDGLQKLASSKKITDQIKALEIMAEVPTPGLVRILMPLLKSQNPILVRYALPVAGAMGHPALLTMVFDALGDSGLQEAAVQALRCYGKKAFPPIEKLLNDAQADRLIQKRLILFLGSLKSGEGKQILLRSLKSQNPKLRKVILQILLSSGIVWVHINKKNVLRQTLSEDIRRARFLIDFVSCYQVAPVPQVSESLDSLRQALKRDIAQTREIVLYQMALLKPEELLLKAVRILTGEDKTLYPAALSALQDLLPHRMYEDTKDILSFDFEEDSADVPLISSDIFRVDLQNLILNPPFLLDEWTRAMIFYCLRQLNDTAALDAVKVGLKDASPYVLEAAMWALIRLEPDRQCAHDMLLDVPTSRLIGQSLDEILNS